MPPPAKQTKLSRYGFQPNGNTSTPTPRYDTVPGNATVDTVTFTVASSTCTHDRVETEGLSEPRSSNSSLTTDDGGRSSRSSSESSTESVHDLGCQCPGQSRQV